MSNHNHQNHSISPRQAAEELRRFINTVEGLLASHSGQNKLNGVSLADVSSTLLRLRETLTYDRQKRDFATDFASKNNNGMELLIRTLSMLQRLLHEASIQQPSSKFSTLLNRNGSNKRRKTGVAEADCLECIKLVSLQMPTAAHVLLEHVTYLEIVLISITSPQLDSKCFALEIITQILDFPEGFTSLFKALTSVAGKNRDDSRLALVVSQLKHGLNTSKLHIQILVTRFLNNLLAYAPSLNHRLIMQAEAEIAGFNAERIEKIVAQYNRQSDFDILKRELIVWKNAYLPLVWLQKKAQEFTFGTQPNEYIRRNHGYSNGSVQQSTNDYVGYRYDTDTLSKQLVHTLLYGIFDLCSVSSQLPIFDKANPTNFYVDYNVQQFQSKSNGEDDSDTSTFVTDRKGQRMYSVSKSSKNNSPRAPVVKEVSRQKKIRTPTMNSTEPPSNRWSTMNGSVQQDDQKILLETNPSYVPYPYNGNKSDNGIAFPKRTSSIPSQFSKSDDRYKRHRNDGILKRPKSEEGVINDDDSDFHRRTRREEEIFRQYGSEKNRRNENEFIIPIRTVDSDKRWDSQRQNFKSQSVDALNNPTIGIEKEWSVPIKRTHTTADRPEPEGRSIGKDELLAGNQKLQRTLSNASEKAKMQGFSYLFPQSPVVEELPVRRAKTPTPLQEQVYSRSGSSDLRYPNRRQSPQRRSMIEGRYPNISNPVKPAPTSPYRADDVIYIPLKVEQTGQVITRPPKKLNKQSNLNINTNNAGSPGDRFDYQTHPKQNFGYQNDKRYEPRPSDMAPDSRRYKRSMKGSSYSDDVEDALKRFDYLNDYSVEESSRSSRYALP